MFVEGGRMLMLARAIVLLAKKSFPCSSPIDATMTTTRACKKIVSPNQERHASSMLLSLREHLLMSAPISPPDGNQVSGLQKQKKMVDL
jgi:hypothetical protein